jgi:hypothetical protein
MSVAAPCSQWIARSPVRNGSTSGRSTASLDLTIDMAATTPIATEMAALARAHAEELRRKSFQALASLPEVDTSSIQVLGKPVSLTIYRNSRSADEVLVVVQAFRERYLGMAAEIRLSGFIARANGELQDAPEEALWDYA